jgi:hypothetical protein
MTQCTGDECKYLPPVHACLIPSGAGTSAIDSDETCVALGGFPTEDLGCVDTYQVAQRKINMDNLNMGAGNGVPGGSGYGGPGGSGYTGPYNNSNGTRRNGGFNGRRDGRRDYNGSGTANGTGTGSGSGTGFGTGSGTGFGSGSGSG